MKQVDTLAIGSCYIDVDVGDMPYDEHGIAADVEMIGGEYHLAAGGSAVNFCRLLQDLGVTSAFVGMVGEDEFGSILERLLTEAGVEPILVRRAEVKTNLSTNLTSQDGKSHNMFTMGTANAALQADNVMPKLREVIPTAKILYMGSCLKLKGLQPSFGVIADIASKGNTSIVVDHGRVPKDVSEESKAMVKALVSLAKYYLPSREEFLTLWEVDSIEAGLEALNNNAPDLTVVVKDGSNGAYYFEHGKVKHVDALKVPKVVKLTGAGDSFNAGFIAAQLRQLPMEECVAFGCSVAAVKISEQEIPVVDW